MDLHKGFASYFIPELCKNIVKAGKNWGLKINWKKSALMTMFNKSKSWKSFKHLGDGAEPQPWDNTTKSTTVQINGPDGIINLPIVTEYKYLGIKIERNLSGKNHLQYIKKKIDFITHSFHALRQASLNNRFCYNTWQVFVRPLLDYTGTYRRYLTIKHNEEYEVLHRQSVKHMLFLPKSIPINFANKMVAYDYSMYIIKLGRINANKIEARMNNYSNSDRLRAKVEFDYAKTDWKRVPYEWRIATALYFRRGKCPCKSEQLSPEHLIQHLHSLGVVNRSVSPYYILLSCLDLREGDDYKYDTSNLINLYNGLCKHFDNNVTTCSSLAPL